MTSTIDQPDILIPKVGIHPGVRFDVYRQWKAVNNSTLGHYDGGSPKHVRQAMLVPEEDTAALLIGHATHTMILEPHLFDETYSISPKCDRRTNAGKAAYADWLAANQSKVGLTDAEYADCIALKDAVMGHPVSAAILTGKGQNELSVVWEQAGLLCKTRIDRFTQYDGWPFVVDIKTTRFTPTARNCDNTVKEYGYHRQAAMNLRGLNAHAKRDRRFAFIFVEKNPPHDVVVRELDRAALDQGERELTLFAARHKACLDSGQWPGISNQIESCTLPKWAIDPNPIQE